jgi:hypothetical protein
MPRQLRGALSVRVDAWAAGPLAVTTIAVARTAATEAPVARDLGRFVMG